MPSTRPAAFDASALLARVWRQSLPILRDRMRCLQEAAEATLASTLSPSARAEAAATAHKLAGSLGMFGYPAGTELARRLEEHLEGCGPHPDGLFLSQIVRELDAMLPLEG